MNESKRHLTQKAMMRPTYFLTLFLVLGLFLPAMSKPPRFGILMNKQRAQLQV